MKKEKYIKIEQKGDVMSVEMKNADELDYLSLAMIIISDVSNEMEIPPEQILISLRAYFEKGSATEGGRFYPDKINKENLN